MELPKLINQAELARILWPNNKSAPQKFSDKLANRQGKKITDQDIGRIKQVLNDLINGLSY